MVPGLEAMGIRMLLNENVVIERGGQRIHLAGIDDADFYKVDNIEKAADTIPHEAFSISSYREAEEIRRTLARAAPADVNRQYDLADVLLQIGGSLNRQKKYDKAVLPYNEAQKTFQGTSKNIPLRCDDRGSSSQRGRSFNPWPLIEAA